MRIIVIGDGKVGRTIVEHICQEGHEVVVIDTDPALIEEVTESYDVMGIVGNGASYEILKSAHANKADIIIAATPYDETNILACLIGKKIGAKSTIARVRNFEYSKQRHIFEKDLGITMTINPENEAANEILKIINFPQALRIDSFAKGKVDLIELFVPENSNLVGKSLIQIYQEYQIKVLICAVQRNDQVIIPSGNFILEAKDKIHITANSQHTLRQFLTKCGLITSKVKDILIVGGSKVGLYLANELLKNKYQVKIIEKDYNKCLELSQLLPKATIIHGDGSDQKVLDDEGINHFDSVVALTGIDEENMVISMYAYKQEVKKVIAKISKTSLVGLLESIAVASIVSPKDITSSRIVSYVRATNNSKGNNVIRLYKLVNNKVEALEFKAKENNRLLNIPLKDIKLKDNILIASIIRNGETIIPNGNDMIMLDDNVVVVTTNQFLDDLNDILG